MKERAPKRNSQRRPSGKDLPRRPERVPFVLTSRSFLIVVLLLASVESLAAQGYWWNRAWRARRDIRCYTRKYALPGSEIGYVRFSTLGLAKEDGSDIRVIAEGKEVPFRLLSVGPGDFASLAFEVNPEREYYQIYFGNSEAKKLPETWQPQRGLLLETRRFRGGPIGNADQIIKAFLNSRPVLGARFVGRIFYGHCLFGRGYNTSSKYTGWFYIRKGGKFEFVTSSDDASCLLVDGKVVASWPGWHGASGYIRPHMKGSIHLNPGLHKLEYYHINGGGGLIQVAAWKPPWGTKYEIIPPGVFTRVNEARVLNVMVLGQLVTPDFDIEHLGEAFLPGYIDAERGGPQDDRYAVKIKFVNLTAGAERRAISCQWDFGDGLSSDEISPEHIYFSMGMHTVTLKVTSKGVTTVTKMKVMIDRDWTKQIERKKDELKDYLPIVRRYDLSRMHAEGLANVLALFKDLDESRLYKNAAKVLLFQTDPVPDLIRFIRTIEFADFLEKEGDIQTLLALFRNSFEKLNDARLKAEIAARAGSAHLFYLADVKSAESYFRQVISELKYNDFTTLRRGYIGMGDVYRYRGDYEKARNYYRKAADIKIFDRNYAQNQSRLGAFDRTVEDFLRRGELEAATDTLNTWLWEYPEERLAGRANILLIRKLFMEGRYQLAINEAEALTRVDPKNNYADEALKIAAQAYLKLNKKKEAAQTLQVLVEDYPESRFNKEASETLKKLKKVLGP